MKRYLIIILVLFGFDSFAQGDDCSNAINLCTLTDGTGDGLYSGTTVGFNNDFTADGGSSSSDMLFYIDLPNGESITIGQTDNDYDSEHELRYGGIDGVDCPGANFIVSDDDPDIQNHSWTNTTGSTQRVYWIQAGWSSNSGNFTLEWAVTGSPCGPPPSCPSVNTLFASSITGTSATLNWTETGSATEWQIEYGPAPLIQGTGTLISSSVDSVLISGLNPITDYEFYVMAVCGVGDSSTWRKSSVFTTPCSTYVPTYVQDFLNFTPNCWEEADAGDIATGPSNFGSGSWGASTTYNNEARINLYTTGKSDWLLSPIFDLSSGGYEVSLSVAVEAWSVGGPSDMGSDDYVTIAYTEDGINWNEIKTFTNSDGIGTSLTTSSYLIPSTGSNVQIGILASEGATDDSEDYYFYIDNFIVRTPPTCPAVSLLNATNVTGNEALLNWTEQGSATEWQIEYGPSPLVQGTGNFVYSSFDSILLTGLSSVTDYEFYVRAICGVGDTSDWLFPSSFTTLETCPTPSTLFTNNITGNEATIFWTENGSASEWQIEYGVSPLTPGSGIIVSSNVDSLVLTGLMPSTSYQFYVMSVCGIGDSSFVVSNSFSTLCATVTPTYIQDFSTFLPNCWEEADAGDLSTGPSSLGSGSWSANTTFGNEVSINLWVTSKSDWLLSPYFDLSGGSFELSLDVAVTDYGNTAPSDMDSDDYVQIAYTEDGINWNDLYTFTNSDNIQNELSNYVFVIPSSGSNVQIGILANEGTTSGSVDYEFYIDNFIVRPASTCPQPKQLQVSNLTGTTADLGWTEQGSATQWVVEYGTAPLNLGTGTITNTSSNPFSVTGLSPNADYQFYVYSACGLGDSSYVVGPYSFSTPCATYTPEYLEEFNSYLPTCWKEAGDGDLVSGPTNYGTSSWGQNNEFGSETSINLYQSDNNDWLISPNFDLSGGDYELSVDVAVTDFGGGAPSNMGADDVVRFMYSEDGLLWNNLKKFTSTDNIQDSLTNFVFPINSNGGNVVFAIYATDGAIDNAEDYEFYVDNFEIRDLTPSCDAPDSLMLVSNDGTSATLSWNDNSGATQWDIQYGETGFTLGSGTIVNATTNPFTITGLTANTNYDFYVKSYCPTGGGTSVYSNGKTFNSTSVSINENLNSLISVYPNPTKDVVNIEMSEFDNNSTIQIISLTGEILKNVRVNSNVNVINVEDLASGIYTVRVQNDNGTGFQKLIIE